METTIDWKTKGLYCATELNHTTVEEAWEEYISQYKSVCTWYRGYKYWRAEPEIISDTEYGSGRKRFKISSRMVLSKNNIDHPEIKEANFTYNNVEYKWNDYGF